MIEFDIAMAVAANAVHSILKGIAASDFVEEYGTKAAYGLREYKVDMVVDILQAQFNRLLTEEERERLTSITWEI